MHGEAIRGEYGEWSACGGRVRGHPVGSKPKWGTGEGDGGQVCRILFGDRLRPAATCVYWPVDN